MYRKLFKTDGESVGWAGIAQNVSTRTRKASFTSALLRYTGRQYTEVAQKQTIGDMPWSKIG